jgi:hypothetical protein
MSLAAASSASRAPSVPPPPNPQSAICNPQSPNAKSYQPSPTDLLIFDLVKMQGHSQSHVASMQRISQPTVSRIVRRVERWQAHAAPRAGGRLDPQERLRAQRWLTYERNELILASCLQIASQMQGCHDVIKRTVRRPDEGSYGRGSYGQGETRTESTIIDRTGIAARFLRLAYRVNMDQLKLAKTWHEESAAEPPPAPFTAEELVHEAEELAADLAELKNRDRDDNSVGWDQAAPAAAGPPDCDSPAPTAGLPTTTPAPFPTPDSQLPTPSAPTPQSPSTTHQAPVNKVHNNSPQKIAATDEDPCTCAPKPAAEKNRCLCMTTPQPTDSPRSEWPQQRPVSSPLNHAHTHEPALATSD